MSENCKARVLIVGGGPAGYTAAIYAARAGLCPILFTGILPGGQLAVTTAVENYPGFAEAIQGPWLMQQMEAQARHVGASISFDLITKVDLSTRPFRCDTDTGRVFFADAMVVATGAQAKWLGLQSEQTLRGRGVSSCATCDGFFFRHRTVAVVGGGNTAAEEALYLSQHASRVVLIHRRSSLRAEKLLQDRLFMHPRISVIWNSILEDILSGGSPEAVTGVCLSNIGNGTKSIIPVDGVFVAIGHSPSTDLFDGQLALDDDGYIQTAPNSTVTSIPGVFAAGDVQDKIFRQAVTAAGSGCMAALEAEKWLRT